MKIFISSLISGFEAFRQAARAAVTSLGHEALMAEDFGARPTTPQIACLNAVREADIVVLILGDRYGALQPSALSATHEEYREAQGRKPVIVFVQSDVVPDARQSEFISEAEGWKEGVFSGRFSNADELRSGVTRALHDYELSTAVGPVNPEQLIARAVVLLKGADRNRSGNPFIGIAVVSGPSQQILRPVEIESASLSDALSQAALFGDTRIFVRSKGVEVELEDSALVISQRDGARITLDEDGAIAINLPAAPADQERRRHGIPSIVEEDVHAQIGAALSYATWLLERIDPTQRLRHIAIAVKVDGADYMAWSTQKERDDNPNTGRMRMHGGSEPAPVHISTVRAALRLNRTRLIEDLIVPLRRSYKTS